MLAYQISRCMQVDLFAAGVTLYKLFFGTFPFHGLKDREICESVMDEEPDFSKDLMKKKPYTQEFRSFLEVQPCKIHLVKIARKITPHTIPAGQAL